MAGSIAGVARAGAKQLGRQPRATERSETSERSKATARASEPTMRDHQPSNPVSWCRSTQLTTSVSLGHGARCGRVAETGLLAPSGPPFLNWGRSGSPTGAELRTCLESRRKEGSCKTRGACGTNSERHSTGGVAPRLGRSCEPPLGVGKGDSGSATVSIVQRDTPGSTDRIRLCELVSKRISGSVFPQLQSDLIRKPLASWP